MSFTPFALTKTWESATDFPTYEENEEQVRADMQCLFTELSDGLNKLITELGKKTSGSSGASNIGISSIVGLEGFDTVQDALLGLKRAIDAATTGTLPDHSITSDKLSRTSDDGGAAVGENNLVDGSVTNQKLGTGAVTGLKCDFSLGLTIAGALTQQGQIILGSNCYGDELPSTPTAGRLFFKKVSAS